MRVRRWAGRTSRRWRSRMSACPRTAGSSRPRTRCHLRRWRPWTPGLRRIVTRSSRASVKTVVRWPTTRHARRCWAQRTMSCRTPASIACPRPATRDSGEDVVGIRSRMVVAALALLAVVAVLVAWWVQTSTGSPLTSDAAPGPLIVPVERTERTARFGVGVSVEYEEGTPVTVAVSGMVTEVLAVSYTHLRAHETRHD